MVGEREVGFHAYFHTRWFNATFLAHAVAHKPRDIISKWDRYLIILFCLFLSIVLFIAQESQKQMARICNDLFAEAGVCLLVLLTLGHEPCGIEWRKHPPLCVHCCGYAECLE